MTPYLLRLAVEAHAEKQKWSNEHDLRMAWYFAAFSRARPLPSLERLFAEKPSPQAEAQMLKAKLIAHNKRVLAKQKRNK